MSLSCGVYTVQRDELLLLVPHVLQGFHGAREILFCIVRALLKLCPIRRKQHEDTDYSVLYHYRLSLFEHEANSSISIKDS